MQALTSDSVVLTPLKGGDDTAKPHHDFLKGAYVPYNDSTDLSAMRFL